MHRVRSIIPYLDYSDLSRNKIIPHEKLFTAKFVDSKGGKTPCPTLAKKLGPVQYGLFVEKVIEILLDNDCDVKHLILLEHTLDTELKKYFTIEPWKDLADLLKREFLNIVVQPQVEIKDAKNNIEGHPDLMSVNAVYDIKTTGRFAAMRTLTIFQLLSYYCLAQINGLNITHVGLVLPLQLKVITHDLTGWNWKPFYKELIKTVDVKLAREEQWKCSDFKFVMLFNQFVGHHCQINSLLDVISKGKPTQFFINGNVTSKVVYTQKFLKDVKGAITNSVTPVFIHSPYVLNLCYPGAGEREGDDKIKEELKDDNWGGWTFYCLKQLLEFGNKTGIRGVVVHCGKTCKKPYDISVSNMLKSVIACSKWASSDSTNSDKLDAFDDKINRCKLLIETSAGQGGEVLYDPKELGEFYNSLPQDVKKNVGICVDTCHVFAAGYDPYAFIETLEKMNVPIDLIHYNDSKGTLGCKKDRHAGIGQGYIGMESMSKVLYYAINHNIPMLTE
jgi:endonuclease IV